MTISEVTALILLYRACDDPALRARIEQLVPDIVEFNELGDDPPRTRQLTPGDRRGIHDAAHGNTFFAPTRKMWNDLV